MKPDSELIAETKAWFKKASHDIRVAELALGDAPAMTDQSVFHAQQAAEKAMKGLLTWHGKIFRKTPQQKIIYIVIIIIITKNNLVNQQQQQQQIKIK